MDIAVGAALSIAMQSVQTRQALSVAAIKQQQQQMQAVADMVATAAGSSAVPGRGEVVDILV